MKILPYTNFLYTTQLKNFVSQLGHKVKMPDETKNYMTFDEENVERISLYREAAIPYLDCFLKTTNDEKAVCEALYTLNKMCDMKVSGIDKCYGTLSKFNNTNSPNIQTFLAGIYRKTQVPDGFGPLVNMLIKNANQQKTFRYFDPNEEIGGAILAYLNNYSKKSADTTGKQKNFLKQQDFAV